MKIFQSLLWIIIFLQAYKEFCVHAIAKLLVELQERNIREKKKTVSS